MLYDLNVLLSKGSPELTRLAYELEAIAEEHEDVQADLSNVVALLLDYTEAIEKEQTEIAYEAFENGKMEGKYQGIEEGYDKGYDEGYKQGYEDGSIDKEKGEK